MVVRMQQIDQILSAEDPLGNGYGEHGVVGEGRPGNKEGEVLCLGPCPFMHRPDHISDDRTQHADCLYPPKFKSCLG